MAPEGDEGCGKGEAKEKQRGKHSRKGVETHFPFPEGIMEAKLRQGCLLTRRENVLHARAPNAIAIECRKNCMYGWREKAWRKEMNKTVYTAALVADGWAGAENIEKVTLLRTDRPTDQPTDQGVELRVCD